MKAKYEVVTLIEGRLAGLFAIVSPDETGDSMVVRDLKLTQEEAERRAAELNASKDGPQ